jgi:two-component system sensor histidine kinase/response regulator
MNPGVDVHIAKPVRPSRLIAALTTGTGDRTNLVDDVMQTGAGGAATGETRALRILLAEDNRVNQRVALAILSKGGHEIDIANDGVEALMMVSKISYDVILMDVQMPNMSGVDVTRKIRRLPGPN